MAKKKPKPSAKTRASANTPSDLPDVLLAHNIADAGDSTARNYRYQYAYGVILLVAARAGHVPYEAIWCEHHEDFLGERIDGRFDGYQIKTSRPENGPWKLTDEALVKSIGRFVDLARELGSRLYEVVFVTNTECDHVTSASRDDRRRGRCPQLFLDHVRQCKTIADMEEPYKNAFSYLAASCACTEAELLSTLRIMRIVIGPSRTEFETVISHDHLATLDECRSLSSSQLDQFRNHLIDLVYRTSSLQNTAPLRHLVGPRDSIPQVLLAKRIRVVDVQFEWDGQRHTVVQFKGASQIDLLAPRQRGVLIAKLKAGGLEDQIEYMRERENAAESHLLEDIQNRPELYPALFDQIVHMVLGECTEAHLRASQSSGSYGPSMLIDVQSRLRDLAESRPRTIGHHPYECLIGMAALLTSDCRVWWSSRFTIPVGAI